MNLKHKNLYLLHALGILFAICMPNKKDTKMKNSEKFDFKFYEWEEKLKDKPFLKQPFGEKWEVYTWGEVGNMARKLANGLKSLGLRENAHIGLVSKNCREWIIADLAILMAGYISVPFFPTLGSKEIKELLNLGDVDALFVGKMEIWDEMKKGVPKEMPIIAFPQYEGNSKVSEGHQWFNFIDKFEPIKQVNVPNLKDPWTIIFTSGTTGTPKGVVLSYGANDETKVLTQDSNPLKINFDGENHFFSYLPLNHIAERIVVEHTCFRFGGTISFTESLETFAQNLQVTQPTVFFAVPRIWTKFQLGILGKLPQKKLNTLLRIPLISGLLKKKFKKALGLSRARAKVSGAAPMQEGQRVWFRKIGIDITNGYGMTENCAITTQLDGKITNKPGSVGLAQTGVELKIDPKNGEILMRGPFLMDGYYKDKKTTEKTIVNGWLHTGDQGYMDEEGFLFITGRVKDTFKTSKGKFIEPLLLEHYFGEISDFEQVCVAGIGLPQPICLATLSDIGKGKEQSVLEEELRTLLLKVNEPLDSYKKISTLVVLNEDWNVENGMTTPTLKIKRTEIDKKYMNNFFDWHNDEKNVIFG